LFHKQVPKTAENFRCFCTGEVKDAGGFSCFRGNFFHKLMNDEFVQAGDTDQRNGNGGHSIYGPSFEDE
jgi:cyclophilin family peptidyl-prolyl cis-trans isomerase